MITCYVVDDEFHAVETLCDIITSIPGLELVGHATSPLVALDFITSSTTPPEITFVDINMPELSGIEFASLVNRQTTVVFTTAYSHFAVEAFEREAFDYLLKPITPERFLKAIGKYKKQHKEPIADDEYFYIKGDAKGKMTRIKTADITHIEGAQNYVIIYTSDGKQHITYLTMGEIQSYLPESLFSRIHRSFIVNNQKIQSIAGNDILLDGKITLIVGAAYKVALLETLNKRLIKTKRVS